MNKKLEIRNGKPHVAVVIHNDYGVGWYTSHECEDLIFDPTLVDMILENKNRDEIMKYCLDNYDREEYYGSCDGLEVVWIPCGVEFEIREYDGLEQIFLREKVKWIIA